MYIENVTLKSVPADSLVLPVEEGTILTKNGTVPASLSQAYGIVPQKITNIPPTKKIYLAVAGTIDLKLNNVSFTEEEMQALGKDFNFVPGDEGGGNPNRVQTITGTMATIADDMIGQISITPPEFFAAIDEKNASAILTVDATAIGSEDGYAPVQCQGSDQLYATNVAARWDNSGVYFDAAVVINIDALIDHYELSAMASVNEIGNTTDLLPYASLLPYTLTIIWHPLPDQS